jgi:hypothetical protein
MRWTIIELAAVLAEVRATCEFGGCKATGGRYVDDGQRTNLSLREVSNAAVDATFEQRYFGKNHFVV